MGGWRARVNDVLLPLVFGASLHWASIMLPMVPPTSETTGWGTFGWLSTVLGACICLAATAFSDVFCRRFSRRAVAALGCTASLVDIALAYYPGGAGFGIAAFVPIAHNMLQAVGICSLVLLWGLSFASLDRRTAGTNVLLTAALCAGLYLCGVSLESVGVLPGSTLENAMRASSALVFLSWKYVPKLGSRPLAEGAGRRLGRFLAVRFLVGTGVGLTASALSVAQPSTALAMAMIPPVVAAGASIVVAGRVAFRVLPVVPLLSVAVVAAPFAGLSVHPVATVAPALCWLCWIEVSSFQISGLKDAFGLGEARLCFAEKSALLFGWVAGLVLVGICGVVIDDVRALLISYAVVVWAVASSLGTVYSRREDEIVRQVDAQRAEHHRKVLAIVTERYGLTERESEVLALLAQGSPRSHVCECLGISDGTARAHVSHIYQKIGIHKREELDAIINENEKDAASGQG